MRSTVTDQIITSQAAACLLIKAALCLLHAEGGRGPLENDRGIVELKPVLWHIHMGSREEGCTDNLSSVIS